MLRFQWNADAPRESPCPPAALGVRLLVGAQVVWSGEVPEELRAWARWCALQAASLWDCPEVVRRYLETGEVGLRPLALDLATEATEQVAPGLEGHVRSYAAWAASDAAQVRLTAAAAADVATSAALALTRAQHPDGDEDGVRATMHAAKEQQAAQLRILLLRRALPPTFWGLVEQPFVGVDEVLCDVLLSQSEA